MRTVTGGVLTVLVTVSLMAVTCACSGDPDDAEPSAASSAPSTLVTSSVATTTAASSSSESSTHRKRHKARPVPDEPIRTITVDGEKDSYVVRVWAQVHDDSCYDHAHGDPVVTYLTTNPCRGLNRLLATTVVADRPVGIAQGSLGFSGGAPAVYRTAGKFRTLVETDGTGNLDDLLRVGYRLPSGPRAVPASYAFSAHSQDSAVTVLEAWYLDGTTPMNDPALLRMAQDLFRQL